MKTKTYMFAIDGQIYQADDETSLGKDMDGEMIKKLVNDTALELAFLAALQKIMKFWHKRSGIHPDIEKMTVFDADDKQRAECLKNTLDHLASRDEPIKPKQSVSSMSKKMATKMFDSVSDMPDAWARDGQLKFKFMLKHRPEMLTK